MVETKEFKIEKVKKRQMQKKIDLVCTRTDPTDSSKTQILLLKSFNKLEIPCNIRVKENTADQDSILTYLYQTFGRREFKSYKDTVSENLVKLYTEKKCKRFVKNSPRIKKMKRSDVQ